MNIKRSHNRRIRDDEVRPRAARPLADDFSTTASTRRNRLRHVFVYLARPPSDGRDAPRRQIIRIDTARRLERATTNIMPNPFSNERMMFLTKLSAIGLQTPSGCHRRNICTIQTYCVLAPFSKRTVAACAGEKNQPKAFTHYNARMTNEENGSKTCFYVV